MTRMLASRMIRPIPQQLKKAVSRVQRLDPPIKGLSLIGKTSIGDPQTATILSNWVLHEDHILVRPGTNKLRQLPAAAVQQLMPYLNAPQRLLAGVGANVYDALTGANIKGGFASSNWHHTMFANLSQVKYLVMVNGLDGVWTFDGTTMVKQAVTAPASMPFCNPDSFQIVVTHINRLYFADPANLAVYFLPLQQVAGEVKRIPLDPIFKRGGTIKAIASWSVDAGAGMDDKLVIFSTHGECAIYTGIDPEDEGFNLIGVYRFDSPMNRYCTSNYGGDLWVLTSTGLAPLTTLMRAETEKINRAEKGVVTFFRDHSIPFAGAAGWYVILDSTTGRMICNMPRGTSGKFRQMIRFMPDPVWATWDNLPALSWAWMEDRLYFGTSTGAIYEVHSNYLSDDGAVIEAEYQGAWLNYKTPGLKHFKMLKVYGMVRGKMARPYVDIAVNHQTRPPENIPEVMSTAQRTPWGSPWGSPWSGGDDFQAIWGGVGRLGTVGAPHILVRVQDASYEVSGFDIVYETGAIGGG